MLRLNFNIIKLTVLLGVLFMLTSLIACSGGGSGENINDNIFGGILQTINSNHKTIDQGQGVSIATSVDDYPIKVNIQSGTFNATTNVTIWKPDFSLSIPKMLVGSIEESTIQVGLTLDANHAYNDILVEIPVYDEIPENQLVIYAWDGSKYIPLEVTEIKQNAPLYAVNKGIVSNLKTAIVKISKEVINSVINTVNKTSAMAKDVKNGIEKSANEIKEVVIKIGKSVYSSMKDAIQAKGFLNKKGLLRYNGSWNVIESASNYTPQKEETVLLAHGILSRVENFANLASSLNEAGFEVLGFNYDFTDDITKNADDLKSVLQTIYQKKNNKKIYICAHSMGGLVSRYAMKIGGDSYVDKLVLLSSVNNGCKITYKIGNFLKDHNIPVTVRIEDFCIGFQQLSTATTSGKSFFFDLNSSWNASTKYYGIIHPQDEWVDPDSWGIFRNNDVAHETPLNGLWDSSDKFLILTKYQNTTAIADSHGASCDDKTEAMPKILTFLKEQSSNQNLSIDLGSGVILELLRIPAGTFRMGSPDTEQDRSLDEGPVHAVTISKDFYIGKYEVTQGQWIKIMGNNPSKFKNGNNFPVDCVSWNDICQAGGFLEKINAIKPSGYNNFRLPTEAEWEYCYLPRKMAGFWQRRLSAFS
jgi:pimeloyl-ACP methyl ester carboxylesterase